jgi:hypothetical protein
MPRDSAGNYTLPTGNPTLSGTTIDTGWANPTLEDMAQSLTNSLSRDGEGGMLVPFKNVDGTEAVPGVSFTNEPNTGFYRLGSGDFRASVLGTQVVRFRDDSDSPPGAQSPFQVFNGMTFANVLTVGYQGQFFAGDGTSAAPIYSFQNSPSTGIYSAGANTLDFSTSGARRLQIDADAITAEVAVELATGPLPPTANYRDGAIFYNGSGGIAIKVGSAWASMPSSAPANNGNLAEVATPIVADGSVLDGVYNFIDTRGGDISLQLPAGVAGMRWGYIDLYRTFNRNNCILVPNGFDEIEELQENYTMNIRGASGVMRYTDARGWIDTGGMS